MFNWIFLAYYWDLTGSRHFLAKFFGEEFQRFLHWCSWHTKSCNAKGMYIHYMVRWYTAPLQSKPIAYSLILQASKDISISICTVDGQTFSCGDRRIQFALYQSVFPFIYALAADQLNYIPSQEFFLRALPPGKSLSFSFRTIPYQFSFHFLKSGSDKLSMTTSGALKMASLLHSSSPADARATYLLHRVSEFAGLSLPGPTLSCSMPTFLSLQNYAHLDYSLAYRMVRYYFILANKLVFPESN